jgi:threonine dehydratase
VVTVSHGRTDPALSLDEVEVLLQLETRGRAHAAQLADRLAQSGYRTEPN